MVHGSGDEQSVGNNAVKVGIRIERPSETPHERDRYGPSVSDSQRAAAPPPAVPEQAVIKGWQSEEYPAVRRARVVFEPTNPLADRWYMISVANVPFPVGVGNEVAHLKLPDGSTGARFRTGSQFVVREIHACESDGSQILKIRFSEPVRLPVKATAVTVVDAGGARTACSRIPDPIDTSPLATELSLTCKQLGLPASVSIDGDLQSLAGDVLTDPAGNSGNQLYFLPLDSRDITASGCRVYYPDEIK
jgi:hypothetical protein